MPDPGPRPVDAQPGVAPPKLSELYRETRERLSALVAGLDPSMVETEVTACPGWTVRDVIAHLTAIPEDVMAGRLTGPPSDEYTAAQVARFDGLQVGEILATWSKVAPAFEEVIDAMEVLPAVLDVAAHEQDIRGSIGLPGARDTEVVRLGADRLITMLDSPVPLKVVVDGVPCRVGPSGGEEIVLTTDHFDAFRWRLGRRSRSQMAGLDWVGDPTAVLDHLALFGPAPIDIIE